MALTESNGLTAADVGAVLGNSNNGFGFGGDGAWWLLVLFLFAFNGNGWGNFGGNGGYSEVQRGFDQQAVMSGVGDISTAISNGFQNTQLNMLQGFNNLTSGLQNCCCENRAATADLKYTVATEACADRSAISDGLRDLIANQNSNTQAILDKLCQQEIDTLKTENARLQTQINLANLAQSQTAQTAKILADNAAQTVALEQYLNPTPVPAYVVQNPNCCGTVGSCGCGMA